MNQDLPGFVVLPEVSYPQGGAANWGNGFLPADFQGTPLRAKGSPILDLDAAAGRHAATTSGRTSTCSPS